MGEMSNLRESVRGRRAGRRLAVLSMLAVFAAALAAVPAFWILLLPSPLGGRLVRRFSV